MWNICIEGRYADIQNGQRKSQKSPLHEEGQKKSRCDEQESQSETTKEINQGGQWFSTGTTTAETEVAIR